MTPKLNAKNRMDGRRLLESVEDDAAALAFADFQYRSVLDRQNYGNEGERQQARADLPQMTDSMIRQFMIELERVVRPSGMICLWLDKFLLVTGKWQAWLPDPTPMRPVDCLILDKERIGMGRRFRSRWEAMVLIQKAPIRASGLWRDRSMPDLFSAKTDRARHVHAKPVVLTRRLIEACTEPGDLIVDPCAGGWGVLEACLSTKRRFMGADVACA